MLQTYNYSHTFTMFFTGDIPTLQQKIGCSHIVEIDITALFIPTFVYPDGDHIIGFRDLYKMLEMTHQHAICFTYAIWSL
jgi:hypothetical protein